MNIDKKSHEISVKHSQVKVKLYDCPSHHHVFTISETELELHNTTFSWVCCMRLEWSTSTAMYCVTMSSHFQINMSVHYVFVISYKSWLQYISRKVMKLLLVQWIRYYVTVNKWL